MNYSSARNKSNFTFYSNDPLEVTKSERMDAGLSQRNPFAVDSKKFSESKDLPRADFTAPTRTASMPPGIFQQKLPQITAVHTGSGVI